MSVIGNKNALKFNMDLVEEICERVSNGESIKAVLKSEKRFPDFSTWCRWRREYPAVNNLYTIAREDKTESYDDKFDSIMNDIQTGVLDAQVGRVLLDALKWKMAKFYPKMFGDNKQIDLLNNGGTFEERPRLSFEDKTKDE